MFSIDNFGSNNFLISYFGESESAAESCVESCGSFTLVSQITSLIYSLPYWCMFSQIKCTFETKYKVHFIVVLISPSRVCLHMKH
jgi:hypothetical protein